jgi:D-tagatose-1,6-bisphosphate aldolase subunit GatZ/KbaZ
MTTTKREPTSSNQLQEHFRQVFLRNRAGERLGTYAICSAHPSVIEASIHQALEDGSFLHVESTSSQVNQFGGYTGVVPEQFAAFVRKQTSSADLREDQVLLGADHLGPFPWRQERASVAMANACELARASVRAGYQKIHLDASTACADDGGAISENVIAERAAILADAAEDEAQKSGQGSPLYVVGTEVPPPGGEVAEGTCPPPTKAEDVHRTLDAFKHAFLARGLQQAWENVVALVVQPGVEFGDTKVFDYDRRRAAALVQGLPPDSSIIYEAHSTDYQQPTSLAELVEDHFAILKVGPWLTFAYREAIFALEMMEREILGKKKGAELSRVKEVLDAEMVRDPKYWGSYYKGSDGEIEFARAFSFSDRCRYYWPRAVVQQEVARLLVNLSSTQLPITLLSQYLPLEYEAVRDGCIVSSTEALILHHIQDVLRQYSAACGTRSRSSRAGV